MTAGNGSKPSFSIVRSTIEDDPKFADIYPDKCALGWWLTLLLIGDRAYPAPAHLPRSLPDEILDRLVANELIDALPHDRFRLHGADNERELRRAETREQRARKAAEARWKGDKPEVEK